MSDSNRHWLCCRVFWRRHSDSDHISVFVGHRLNRLRNANSKVRLIVSLNFGNIGNNDLRNRPAYGRRKSFQRCRPLPPKPVDASVDNVHHHCVQRSDNLLNCCVDRKAEHLAWHRQRRRIAMFFVNVKLLFKCRK